MCYNIFEQFLEEKVEQSIKKDKVFSLTILSFVIIIREGIDLYFCKQKQPQKDH